MNRATLQQRLLDFVPGRSARPVNAGRVAPEHPEAPYPSNATERPARFYQPSGDPIMQRDGTPGVDTTTTALLPPVGSGIDAPPMLTTALGLEMGRPPIRIPRLYPNREPAGIRFAGMTNSMGLPNGDLYFVPLPAIPKTTAVPSRVRLGMPQFANDLRIPSVYVGGDV